MAYPNPLSDWWKKPEFADYNAVYIFSHTSTHFILLKNVGLIIVKGAKS